jgi:hypothetical protein
MYLFKYFYIFEESDFVFHFLLQEKMDTSKRSMETFDKTLPKYVSFRRKIVADNLLNTNKEWEHNLPKEQLQKLNSERLKAELNSIKNQTPFNKFAYDEYVVGDYIWFNRNKGEVTKVHNLKNENKLYDIKVGRENFTKLHCNDLRQRDNIRKQLESIPDNVEFQKLKTEQLLVKMKKLRPSIYTHHIGTEGYMEYMQLKKELCKRPHVKKKESKYNR